ncbi:hypothetical protein HHI36_012546 [Cryptolaemus montrouzieri]|uniref:RING-type domain-containing protein n=1 Tax=Cryptolaemus montrouzieri TaxID=559131 RepID=A0ABD2NF89_9CUCU
MKLLYPFKWNNNYETRKFQFFSQISILIKDLILWICNFITLCGSGVWFLLTGVPMLIYCFCINSISFLTNIHVIVKKQLDWKLSITITNIYNFFVEVPIESLTGLLSIIFIIYVLSRFYILIFRYLRLILRNSYRILTERYILMKFQIKTFWLKCIRRIFTRRLVNVEKKDLEQFCIICQERSRCIVILPCRHLCLCRECNVVLRRYHSNCPICRQEIEHTMKVFL